MDFQVLVINAVGVPERLSSPSDWETAHWIFSQIVLDKHRYAGLPVPLEADLVDLDQYTFEDIGEGCGGVYILQSE